MTSNKFIQELLNGACFYGESEAEINEVIQFLVDHKYQMEGFLMAHFPNQGSRWRVLTLDPQIRCWSHPVPSPTYCLTYGDYLSIKDETSPIDSDGLVRGLCDLF